MEYYYQTYNEVLSHYSEYSYEIKSWDFKRYYLFGVILLTELDKNLLLEFLNNFSELHYSTGEKILLSLYTPDHNLTEKAPSTYFSKPKDLGIAFYSNVTKHTYEFLEDKGLNRSYLPCIIFYERDQFDTSLILSIKGDSFHQTIEKLRELADFFYSTNNNFFKLEDLKDKLSWSLYRTPDFKKMEETLQKIGYLKQILKELNKILSERGNVIFQNECEELIENQKNLFFNIYPERIKNEIPFRYNLIRSPKSPRFYPMTQSKKINSNLIWLDTFESLLCSEIEYSTTERKKNRINGIRNS